MNRCLTSFVTCCWVSLIALGLSFSFPDAPAFAALPGMSALFSGNAPELGIIEGHLAPCPPSPNCVVSQGGDVEHQIGGVADPGQRTPPPHTPLKGGRGVTPTPQGEPTAEE
ncbi:MAG: hypothetical protein AAGG51_29580, partial [Cyanobacteria bacterium P01_G01_bin.54]